MGLNSGTDLTGLTKMQRKLEYILLKEAGLVKNILFGAGKKIIPKSERIISEFGHILPNKDKIKFTSLFSETRPKGAIKEWAKQTFVGYKPLTVLKQRAMQGGLIGKGGLLRSTVALPEDVRKAKNTLGTWGAIKKHPFQTGMWGLGAGMTVGMPAFMVGNDIYRGDYKHIPASLASGLTWSITEPFAIMPQMLLQPVADMGVEKGLNYAGSKVKGLLTPKATRPAMNTVARRAPTVKHISPYSYA